MSEFEREERYIVIKLKDVDNYLDDNYKDKLVAVCNEIADFRSLDNQEPLNCVVIEDDWPMYEDTWKAIQEYVETGEYQKRYTQSDLDTLKAEYEAKIDGLLDEVLEIFDTTSSNYAKREAIAKLKDKE